jgi:hypothetical protein
MEGESLDAVKKKIKIYIYIGIIIIIHELLNKQDAKFIKYGQQLFFQLRF